MESKSILDFNIEEYIGKTIVIKFGGSIMKNEKCKEAFYQDIAYLKENGVNIVIVHGGGPNISSMLEKVGSETKFINGLRVTDKNSMEIVEMTLAGSVNKELSGKLANYSINAIGLSGRESDLIEAKKKFSYVDGEKIDLGFVGEVEKINTPVLNLLIKSGFLPVIAPIGFDKDGNIYNINADYVAGSISAALHADKLILMTDVEGVYLDINDKSSLLKSVTINEIKEYIKTGVIHGGMIPKMECCMNAIENGTKAVHLVDGRREHSLLTDVFYSTSNSTSINGGN